MPSLMLRQIPESLMARLRDRAHLHGLPLRATVLRLLETGLRADPVAAGHRGATARAEALTADQRTAIARRAAQSRWRQPPECP